MVFFSRFSIIFNIFDLCILKLVFKRSIFLQRKNLEAHFWSPNSKFYFHFSKHPAGISNVRPKNRTSGRNFERSTRNSNVRQEIRTFDQKFERSTGNSVIFCDIFGESCDMPGEPCPGVGEPGVAGNGTHT